MMVERGRSGEGVKSGFCSPRVVEGNSSFRYAHTKKQEHQARVDSTYSVATRLEMDVNVSSILGRVAHAE